MFKRLWKKFTKAADEVANTPLEVDDIKRYDPLQASLHETLEGLPPEVSSGIWVERRLGQWRLAIRIALGVLMLFVIAGVAWWFWP